MIRPLRQRHRVMVLTLAVLLPAGFVLGIATRKSVPTVPALPTPLASEAHRFHSALWAREDLWPRHPIRTRLLADESGAQLAVELAPKEAIVLPDVLVYWVPGETAVRNTLPDSAFLLGTLSANPPRPLPLPPDASRRQGALILYSLADQEIVETSRLFAAK
jgi:hypothetical protein